MEARQISIDEFLSSNKTRFIIPVYQRNYDWKEKNCQQLLNDILNIGNDNRKIHFLGSIVYVSNSDTETIDLKEYVIIDGQQRLTTSILLMKSIHDSTTNDDLRDEILERFLINKRLSEKNKLKLKPIKKDNDVFEKLMNNDFESLNQSSNIYKNYKFFVNYLESNKNHHEIFSKFQKLFVVHIALNRRDDNAQLIFESINSTGVSLSQSDLIRNFLLMDKEPQEQEILFEKFWLKIEDNLSSDHISIFIRDYLTVKNKRISNKDDVYDSFKYYVIANKEFIKLDNLLRDLVYFSNIYRKFIFETNDFYSIYLKNLRALKTTTVYPFLMSVIQKYDEKIISKEVLLNVLFIIESYIVRRIVCNKPTNALNKVFANLYDEVINSLGFSFDKFDSYLSAILLSKKGSAVFPDDILFKKDFCSIDAYSLKNLKFILASLENKDNKEYVDQSALSIEHFMPQKLTESWKTTLGSDYDLIHVQFLHNIGNLTLSGDNSQLGNKSFSEKIKILNEQSALRLNRYFTKINTWNDDEIRKRADYLFVDAKGIWLYPETLATQVTINPEDNFIYTLDDLDDATFTKPIYFELKGEKILSRSWAEMLIKLSERLIFIDDNIFESFTKDDDFSSKKGRFLSFNESDIRKPNKINDVYYIETNLSASAIWGYIKLMCEKYNLSGDDLTICVSKNET